MKMSLISVDFGSLERQAACLDYIRCRIEEINNRILDTAYSLDGMKPDRPVSELKAAAKRLSDIAERIERYRTELIKIIGLYEECENSITESVMEAASALLLLPSTGTVPRGSEIRAFGKKSGLAGGHIGNIGFYELSDSGNGFFGSHSVINDSWLEELIYNDLQKNDS